MGFSTTAKVLSIGLFLSAALQAKPISYQQSQIVTGMAFKAYQDKMAYSDLLKQVSSTVGEPWSKSDEDAKWVVKLDGPPCRQAILQPPPDPKFPMGSGGGIADDPAQCKKHKPLTKEQSREFEDTVMQARMKNIGYAAAVKQLDAKLGKHHSDKWGKTAAAIWYWQDAGEKLCQGVEIKKDAQNPAGFLLQDFAPPADACQG